MAFVEFPLSARIAETEPRPTTWNNSIVYEAYPESFQSQEDEGIPYLQQLTHKLGYLQNTLHVNAVWLTPVHSSSGYDMRYDVTDFYSIDPELGTMKDFDTLVQEADKRGIKIILDFVANHISIDHPWFQEVLQNPNSFKRDWFFFKESPDSQQPSNTPPSQTVIHNGKPGWHFVPEVGMWNWRSVSDQQVDIDWGNEGVQKAMVEVLQFWQKRGVGGFRIDMANHLGKDPRFHDHSAAITNDVSIKNGPSMLQAIQIIRETVSPEKILLLEIADDYLPASTLLPYYDVGKNIAPLYLPPFSTRTTWGAEEYKAFLDDIYATLPLDGIPALAMSSHDARRIISEVGEEKAKQIAMFTLTQRGMSVLYNGDEVGTENYMPPQPIDPFGTRDAGRGPIDWRRMSTQREDPLSMLTLQCRLTALKQTSNALRFGAYDSRIIGLHAFRYAWTTQKENLVVLHNFSDKDIICPIEGENIMEYISTKRQNLALDNGRIHLMPGESVTLNYSYGAL